ncbi:MAG: sugar transferase [Deltaproteobacteria bacterium]|nr:sugar transferase [Deltaproteobacteria bacterium]
MSDDGAQERGIYPVAKRLCDITGAALGLVGFGLLSPFIALAIKLDSPGPIFYRQTRVGRGGKTFVIRKLRTMVADAEKEEDFWSNHTDPRVTRVGRWLRKTRLDEVPQYWRILKGEMSIVGPRPERLNVVKRLEKELPLYHLRYIAKPGLVGWAMVNRGYMCSFEDAKVRHEYDLYYVKHRSFWFDALIFLRAFWHLLTMRGR